MNDDIDFNVLFTMVAIGILIGMALIGGVRLIDGPNHRLGLIQLPPTNFTSNPRCY